MQLSHGEFAINGYRFGCNHAVGVGELKATNAAWRVQDQPNPVGNNILLGRDYLDPQPVTLGLTIRGDDPATLAKEVAEFAEQWMTAANRGPGQESVLEVGVHGRTYRAYGRPRGLDIEDSNYFAQPLTRGQAVFERSDQLWYGDTASGGGQVTLSITPPQLVGIKSPMVGPISTLRGGERQGVVTNSGTRSTTDVTITINGTVTRPIVSGDGWEIELDYTLDYDRYVVIDARAKTVTLDDGTSLAGKLTRSSRLTQIIVPSGASEFKFRGTSSDGSATATIRWGSAHASLGV